MVILLSYLVLKYSLCRKRQLEQCAKINKRNTLLNIYKCMYIQGFPRRLSRKDSDCLTGDVSSIPGSGRTPGVENGNPLQYSCLGNLGRGAWQANIHGVTKSQTWLSTPGQWSFSSYLVLTCSLCSKRWVEECAKINQRSKLLNIYINACIFKDWGKMFENYLSTYISDKELVAKVYEQSS